MGQKRLKCGYTTGTCAAAAAKAAALFWLSKEELSAVDVMLPESSRCRLDVCRVQMGDSEWYGVKKDAGDDPDVTHGAWICASVDAIGLRTLDELKKSGKGYWMEAHPNLYLTGSEGIGIVTKEGLSCPKGHYAINPGPRKMILEAVAEVCSQYGHSEAVLVRIGVPEGRELAQRTFNPRLGIVNGISILGTTGVVKPMSEEALVDTIRLEIHMRAVAGQRVLLMTPGNYGEMFLKERLGVETGSAVLCSNFVQDAAACAARESIPQLLFVGHIGKLVKVAAGAGNTHSRYGDRRLEQMARLTEEVLSERGTESVFAELTKKVRTCNTTEEAVGLLQYAGIAEQVLCLAADRVKRQLEIWTGPGTEIQAVTFSSAYGILGATANALQMLGHWKEEYRLWEKTE